MGETPKPPQLAGPDDRLQQIRDSQVAQAQSFGANMPAMQKKQYNIAQDQASADLTNQKKKIDQTSQGRGILFSGINAANKSSAQGAAASALANRRASINKDLQGQLSGLQNQAVNTGLSVDQAENDRQRDQYNLIQEYNKSKGLFG